MRLGATDEFTRVLRFGAVGLAQNALGFAGYLVLEPALGSHTSAMTIAYVAGLAFAYLGNRSWTFGGRSRNAATLPRFVMLYASGYAVALLIHLGLVDEVGMNHVIAQAITIISCAVIMYVGQKYWVFQVHTKEGP